MIVLPDGIVSNAATWTLIDMGFVQEGAGGLGDRIDRGGNHWQFALDFPAMLEDAARAFEARITRAIRQGLRVRIPLPRGGQGNPGAPVVDGDEPSGTALPIRGLNPGYVAKEGYWLTVIDGTTGKGDAHKVAAPGRADALGKLILNVEPPLRTPFADGDVVLLAAPTIEGALRTPPSWMLAVDHLVRNGASLTIEEVQGARLLESVA